MSRHRLRMGPMILLVELAQRINRILVVYSAHWHSIVIIRITSGDLLSMVRRSAA